jgi:hypothetical protein
VQIILFLCDLLQQYEQINVTTSSFKNLHIMHFNFMLILVHAKFIYNTIFYWKITRTTGFNPYGKWKALFTVYYYIIYLNWNVLMYLVWKERNCDVQLISTDSSENAKYKTSQCTRNKLRLVQFGYIPSTLGRFVFCIFTRDTLLNPKKIFDVSSFSMKWLKILLSS